MTRKIIIPVDSILEMMKSYTRGEGSIPTNAVPVSLQINTKEKGMFGLMVQSPEFKDDTPVRVEFSIKRVFAV